MIVPAARRAIVLASDGDLGERLGVFYASYLAGFVFGPPIAGALTVIADVRLPFVVLGAGRRRQQPRAARRRRRRAGPARRARRPRRPPGPAPPARAPAPHRRPARRRLVPLLRRRLRTAVGDVPRRPRRRDDGRDDLADRVRPADAADRPLGGAAVGHLRPAADVAAGGGRHRAADGHLRLRRRAAARDADGDPPRHRRGDPVARHAGRGRRRRAAARRRRRAGPRRGRRIGAPRRSAPSPRRRCSTTSAPARRG